MLMNDGPLQVLFYALLPNPTFYLVNLETPPFWGFWRHIEPRGCVESKSWIIQNFLRNIFYGGSFLIKKPKFSPLPEPRGTRGALRVRQIKKLHKEKTTSARFFGGPSYKKCLNSKIWSAPRPALPSGPVFSGCGPKIKIPLPMFCSPRCPDSEKVRHDPSAPKLPEEIDLAPVSDSSA